MPCRGRFSGALNGTFDITLEVGRASLICAVSVHGGERASGRRGRDGALPRDTSSGSHVTSSQRGATRGVREGSCPGRPAPGPARGMRHGSLEAGAAQPPGLPRGPLPLPRGSSPGSQGQVGLPIPGAAGPAGCPPTPRPSPSAQGPRSGTWALGRHLLHLNLTAT